MKKSLVSAALAAMLHGALATAPVEAASITLALDSVPNRDGSGTYRWADTFVSALKHMGWQTETFPKDAIGGEDERIDQVRSGILDVSMSDFGRAAQLSPEMRVVQLPYTFQDVEHEFRYITQSGFLDEMNEKLAAHDLRVIAVVPNGGFLGIFNSRKPVHSVADMPGLRMRALDQTQLAMFEMMGASGVVIPFAEVPNAIQTGIADGYVNAAGVPITFGQTELFKHYTDAKVLISARLALASAAWWNGLSDEEKTQVEQAALSASKDVFTWAAEVEDYQEEQLRKAGIEVYLPSAEEIESFRKATTGMTSTIPDVDAARIDAILNDIESYRD